MRTDIRPELLDPDRNPDGWPWTLTDDDVVNVRGESVPVADVFRYAQRMSRFYSVAGDLWNALESWMPDIEEAADRKHDETDGGSSVSMTMAKMAVEDYERLDGLRDDR